MGIKRALNLISIFLLVFVLCATANAEKLTPSESEELRRAVVASEKAEGVRLDDYELIDQDGVRFKLSEYFKDGKPLVVSFIYTKCPQVCPAITAEFKKTVDEARAKFKDRFNVLSIGFDPENDNPESLREYGAKYTKDFSSFRFATSDADTVKRLTAQFGFFNKKSAQGVFDHLDMVTVVRADGTVYKQVYGIRTQSAAMVDRLDELITGKPVLTPSSSLMEKFKFFCYRYDPYRGRYVLDYPIFVAVALQAFVMGLIIYAVWGKRIREYLKRTLKGR